MTLLLVSLTPCLNVSITFLAPRKTVQISNKLPPDVNVNALEIKLFIMNKTNTKLLQEVIL